MGSIGSAPYFRQPDRITYDVLTGYTIEKRWSGRSDSLLTDAFSPAGLGVGGQRVDYTSTGAKADVVVTFRNGLSDGTPATQPVITYSLRTEANNLSIFKNPTFSGLNFATVKVIRDEASGNGGSGTETDNAAGYAGSFARIRNAADNAGDDSAVALKAYRLLLAGDEYYLAAQSYVLTVTRTAQFGFSFGNLTAAYADDGKVFSTGGLSTYIGSVLPWTIPQLSAIPESAALSLAFGWLKRGTDAADSAGGTVQLSEAWQSSRWSLLDYSIASWG